MQDTGAKAHPTRQPWLLVSCLILVALSTVTVASNEGTPMAVSLGDKRPHFELPDLQDQMRAINEWDGQIIVLNFWATWCPPCVHEIPLFGELQQQFAEHNVQFLGVATDTKANIQRFTKKHPLAYPTLYGQNAATSLAKRYGNRFGSLPYTVIIGRQGSILHMHNGELDRVQATALLENAIAQP